MEGVTAVVLAIALVMTKVGLALIAAALVFATCWGVISVIRIGRHIWK